MAKVQQKYEKITPFGGINFVMDKFDGLLGGEIDSHLGLRSTTVGYQYSEIIRAIVCVFLCGGSCVEDLSQFLKDYLVERPHTRVPSADTVLRGISELATENISYTAEMSGNSYDFNTAASLNELLLKLLIATGQLVPGRSYDVDFDHMFLKAEKYDAKLTYKHFDGYRPGVVTIGGLIVYVENADGNTNVRFMQAETLRRFFELMKRLGIGIRSFRADCGSYSEDIVKVVMEYTDKFYIRAERCESLYGRVTRQTGWTQAEIGYQECELQSFPFESFKDVTHCRSVVQRQRVGKGEQLDIFDGEYTYRSILTSDWDMDDEGDCTALQRPRCIRAGVRRAEQRLRMGTPAQVLHEREHCVHGTYCHSRKLLPIHRVLAPHGLPLRSGGDLQGKAFRVPLRHRPRKVGQDCPPGCAQHLFRATLRTFVRPRVGKTPSRTFLGPQINLGKGEVLSPT